MGKVRTPNIQLREHREQHHLTQATLAEMLGVSTLTVGRWERGEAFPTPYALKKLCTILEADAEALGFSQEGGEETTSGESVKPVLDRSLAPRVRRRTLLTSVVTGSLVAATGAALLIHEVKGSAPAALPSPQFSQPQTLQPSLVYTNHTKRVESVAWHPTDAYLASASADGIVRVWSTQNKDDISVSQCAMRGIFWLAWSPDGRRLALAGSERSVWIIPALASGYLTPDKCPLPYRGHQGDVLSCAWSPDGQWIVSGGMDEMLQVWSANTMSLRFPPIRLASPVETVSWSPDERTLLFGAGDGQIYRCDASSGQHLTKYSGHASAVNVLEWAPSGQQFVSASDDGIVRIWNVATGRVERTYQANKKQVDATAWSADGRYLASGGKDNLAHIWKASTAQNLYTCAGNSSILNALAWSHRGYRLASAGQDQVVRVWDLDTLLR